THRPVTGGEHSLAPGADHAPSRARSARATRVHRAEGRGRRYPAAVQGPHPGAGWPAPPGPVPGAPYAMPPHGGPAPRKKASALTMLGVGCLVALLCVAIACAGSCAACVAWSDPGDLTYHASGGSCWLDVVFLDEDGKEVRYARVRGGSGAGGTAAWTNTVDLGPGDRF